LFEPWAIIKGLGGLHPGPFLTTPGGGGSVQPPEAKMGAHYTSQGWPPPSPLKTLSKFSLPLDWKKARSQPAAGLEPLPGLGYPPPERPWFTHCSPRGVDVTALCSGGRGVAPVRVACHATATVVLTSDGTLTQLGPHLCGWGPTMIPPQGRRRGQQGAGRKCPPPELPNTTPEVKGEPLYTEGGRRGLWVNGFVPLWNEWGRICLSAIHFILAFFKQIFLAHKCF